MVLSLLSCVWLVGVGQSEPDLASLKVSAKKILARAYSQAEEPPFSFFGNAEPQIERSDRTKSVSLGYPGGMVSFSISDGRPKYFECSTKPDQTFDPPLNVKQRRSRVSGFAREFMPGKALLIESVGPEASSGFIVRVLEQGTPFYDGMWLRVEAATGVITHGGFPRPQPPVGRALGPEELSHKDNAVGTALHKALERDPELQTFEILSARKFWIVPKVEYRLNAPQHVLRAESEQKAILAYEIGAVGWRLADSERREEKIGNVWIDAESGRPIMGRLVHVDTFGPAPKSPPKLVNHPKQIFVKKTWTKVKTATPTDKGPDGPKGAAILVRDGAAVVCARLDEKGRILWLPTANGWKTFRIDY